MIGAARRRSLALGAVLAIVLTVARAAAPAAAGSPAHGDAPAWCDAGGARCWAGVSPGRSSGVVAALAPGRSSRSMPDPCITRRLNPQPPPGDPLWRGHRDGVLFVRACPLIPGAAGAGNLGGLQILWSARQPPPVLAAVLAHRALAGLRLPRPVLGLSPGWRRQDGRTVTYVGAWTWFWARGESWRTVRATAAAGTQWAEVTVRPSRLVFTPGAGQGPVSCPGPGRPWRPAAGGYRPPDGCGYRYATPAGRVHARLAIEWSVTWAASDGQRGRLPPLITSSTADLTVEQIQAITRSPGQPHR